MTRIYLLALLIIIAINLSAQIDTTRKDFYPLHEGNIWQYRRPNNFLGTSIIGSDTLIDGVKYYVYENVALRTLGSKQRIDSLLRIQNLKGSPSFGDSCGGSTPYEMSFYHLNEPDSTVWEICDAFSGHLGDQLIRFNRTFLQNIFGQTREVMEFDYGGALVGEDTAWSYGAKLAKGIGIVEERYFDGEYRILQGAIINGVQYGTVVSVDEINETIPEELILYQNYPNPFNPSSSIKYQIPKHSFVTIKLFDILGKEIQTLVNEAKSIGNYKVEIDGTDLPSGIYFYRLQAGDFAETKKMVLIK